MTGRPPTAMRRRRPKHRRIPRPPSNRRTRLRRRIPQPRRSNSRSADDPPETPKRRISMTDGFSRIEDESDGDTLHDECGGFAILGHPDAAAPTALDLHALQHPGQQAAGIVSFDGKQFHAEKRMGLVGDHYTDPATLAKLPGTIAIGHTRYSTTGEVALRNVQPLFAELEVGGIAIAH